MLDCIAALETVAIELRGMYGAQNGPERIMWGDGSLLVLASGAADVARGWLLRVVQELG
jgi:hypothetical protein